MIERTHQDWCKNLLENNPNMRVLDIGSRNSGWKQANVYADLDDHNNYYRQLYKDDYDTGKKYFVKLDCSMRLPFKDKEFDFVIASHVLEHLEDPAKFLQEISRIGKSGYIEVPTPLWDNLVDEPPIPPTKTCHQSWITFDDIDKKIVISKRVQIFHHVLTIGEHQFLSAIFPESAYTKLYWKDKIEFKVGDNQYQYTNNRDVDIEADLSNWGFLPFQFSKWDVNFRHLWEFRRDRHSKKIK